MIVVTGGAGFIGSEFVRQWIAEESSQLVNIDKLTYSGNLENLAAVGGNSRHHFVQADIGDQAVIEQVLHEHKPRAIIHFAAESHVDRSIHAPADFIQTNIDGTFRLLEAVRAWRAAAPKEFKFVHISTDEVFGSLPLKAAAISESAAYAPGNPYAASKAAADHLVRAYIRTYDLPAVIVHCCNNYGPFQFPEKLIPLMIARGLAGESLPIYGDGLHERDWLHVSDAVRAIRLVLAGGRIGESYNIAAGQACSNLQVVGMLCDLLDELRPQSPFKPHRQLIKHVAERPGHDRRYALNADKIARELGWQPQVSLLDGLRQTLEWYLGNKAWLENVVSGRYRQWIADNYGWRNKRS